LFQAQLLLQKPLVMMEGALGERLKREYGIDTMGRQYMAGLVRKPEGRAALRAIWQSYIDVAARYGLPFIATTPTRRMNRITLPQAGLDEQILYENVAFLREVRDAAGIDMLAGGMMGCFGNAFTAEGCLTEADAYALHRWAAEHYRCAGADFLFAALIPTLAEALGISRAMAETGLPYLLSFTLQGDGRLIGSTTIADAVAAVEDAVFPAPVLYMTNCVHPQIVYEALSQPFNRTDAVHTRFRGLQANTSALPYSVLDASPVLYSSPPDELAQGMAALQRDFGFTLFGGCCGTDHTHMAAMAAALTGEAAPATV
jgi:S-methylmethionine-dependent homocysteine/selenocysteine methylase